MKAMCVWGWCRARSQKAWSSMAENYCLALHMLFSILMTNEEKLLMCLGQGLGF